MGLDGSSWSAGAERETHYISLVQRNENEIMYPLPIGLGNPVGFSSPECQMLQRTGSHLSFCANARATKSDGKGGLFSLWVSERKVKYHRRLKRKFIDVCNFIVLR